MTILVTLLHPKSVGTVRLNLNDPFALPLINANYLQEQDDIQLYIKGIDTWNIWHHLSECKQFYGEKNAHNFNEKLSLFNNTGV